jgi:hypothetical protein
MNRILPQNFHWGGGEEENCENSRYTQSPGWELNPYLAEYQAKMITTQRRLSVIRVSFCDGMVMNYVLRGMRKELMLASLSFCRFQLFSGMTDRNSDHNRSSVSVTLNSLWHIPGVRRYLIIAEVLYQFKSSPCGICGRLSATGA